MQKSAGPGQRRLVGRLSGHLSDAFEPLQHLTAWGSGVSAKTALAPAPWPTGRTKPEASLIVPKHRPDPSPEQFDLWGAFADFSELDQTVEVAPQRRAKTRQRRGSRSP